MGIKIAVFPKCFEYDIGLDHTMSVFDWIEMARANLVVEGLELYDRFLTSFEEEYLLQVVDAVHKAGFVIPMFICSPDFTHPDPNERKRALDYEAKMIEVAHVLGGNGTVCRILSGQQHPGIEREQGIAWVVEAVQQLIPVARSYGVILGMENHYKDSQWKFPEFAMKIDVFMEIVNRIDERHYFGIQYDPSNAIVAGDDPIAFLEAIKDRVVSMHASDRSIKTGITHEQFEAAEGKMGYAPYLRHGVIGKGLNDYNKIFQLLAEAGYDGWISVEDGVNGIDEMRQSVAFLKKLRKKYFLK